MEQTAITYSAEETRALGQKMAESLSSGTLLCLTGDLGAGKTTFTQGLLAGFGATRPYISPTFVIMKQYDLPASSSTGIKRVYHCDAYRVGEKDFRELGFAEWCTDPEGVVILEWPERIQNILPEKRIEITLQLVAENEREMRVEEKEG